MKKYNLSKICATANTLHKRGYTLSQAFVLAWAIAKGTQTNVAGTSKLNRQKAIERLTKYQPNEVKFSLDREANNQYDNNAVAVMVSVRNSAPYKLGDIPSVTAPIVSSVLDNGSSVTANLKAIVGGWADGINYGIKINLHI